MTNPEDPRDPRTPQERAYDPAEQARPADETVQWARPGDDSTQQIPPMAPDQPTEQYYTADPYQAYGSPPPNATQAYPTYDPRLDPQAPPSNPTQSYPTYYGQGGYPPPGPPPTGEVPSIENTPEHKPGRRVGLWAAVGAGAVLLALGLGIGFLLNSGGPDNSTTAAAPSTRTAPPTMPGQPRNTLPPTSAPDTTSPLESIPGGVGELIGKAGTAMGTITTNDGGTLTLNAIGGSTITVLTTDDTTLISLTARTVADLKPGESVLVQGDKVEGGAVTAKLIIGTTLPDFGN